MKNLRYSVLMLVLPVFLLSCADLDLENENETDSSWIDSDPDALFDLAGITFRTFHNQLQEYSGEALNMAAMADHLTCPWGFSRDLSMEPRVFSYNNSLNYAYYSYYLLPQWAEIYSAISYSNFILQNIYNNLNSVELTEEEIDLLEAYCWFVSGVSHGYLGLIFDKALVIKYDSDLSNYTLRSWSEVIYESLDMLDTAIGLAESGSFEVPGEWMGGKPMTGIELAQLARSYAARILVYSSRNKQQNLQLDWTRVLSYARDGIDYDFQPVLGDEYGFLDTYWTYATYPGWARVDHRIINLMDHDYPSRWPRDGHSWTTPDGEDPGEADPVDARLLTDFEYLISQNFPPSRGYYYFSHYRFSRYDYLRDEAWYGIGPRPSFMAWELRLIEAEALYRTGNSTGALAILNDPMGPRKVRGMLPDITLEDDILRYILDEKEIECFCTGAGISFFDMRRTDRLQAGTLLHFPVPATELELMGLEHYTIHNFEDGIEGSAGGWTGWDE